MRLRASYAARTASCSRSEPRTCHRVYCGPTKQLQRVVVILLASQNVAGHLVWSRLAATAAELQLPALPIDSDSARVRLLDDMHEMMYACEEHARPEPRPSCGPLVLATSGTTTAGAAGWQPCEQDSQRKVCTHTTTQSKHHHCIPDGTQCTCC